MANQSQRNMRIKLRVYPILVAILFIFGTGIQAQDLNPSFIKGKILKGGSFDTVIYSRLPIKTVSIRNATEAEVSESVVETGLLQRFTYTPDAGFTGRASFVVERASDENLDIPSFTPIEVDVVPSLLEARPDVATIPIGSSSVSIDVLSNDIAGSGATTLLGTELVEHGSVTQNGQLLVFTPDAGFTGQTSFSYFIADANGYKTSGYVTVDVLSQSLSNGTVLEYAVLSGQKLHIFLDDQYALAEGTALMTQAHLTPLTDYVWEYTASAYYSGTESFEIVKANGDRVTVIIEVIDNRISGDFVKDDIVYTAVDKAVSFDAFENDYRRDGLLLDYSDELTLDEGQFSYTPDPGYSGVKEFYYTIFDGRQELEGRIEVYVGNYLPQRTSYQFTTKKGTPVAIQYDAPIKGYTWNIIKNPTRGNLISNLGSYIHENADCESITGYRLLVYRPNPSYVGTDEFKVEYCAPNGACKEISVEVTVTPSTDVCPCYGNDCVWAGDADNNGKVSVQDLLAIGYNYGSSGSPRSTLGTDWCANHADDWAFDQHYGSANIKFADADGDGLISAADVKAISANYASYHNMASREVLAEKEDVLTLTPSQTSVKKDEVIYVDISLGSLEHPVIDRQGIAFSFQIPTEYFKKDEIYFYPNTDWFGTNSPVLTMSKVTEGLVEVAMVRTSSLGAFGKGLLGTVQITGQIDVDGLRPAGDEVLIDFNFSEAIVTDGSGRKFQIQTAGAPLTYQLASAETDPQPNPEVTIFPNPSEYQLSFHARNNDELVAVRIYSVTGALAYGKTDIGAKDFTLEHDFAEGLYLAAVQTQKGVITQSVVIGRK